VPEIDVLGAKVAVGGRGPEVTARVAAGEDARAKVCVRAASYALSALERCRSVAVPGLRPLYVAVRAPAGTTGRVEVAVQFAAESNRTRRTLVVRQATLTR
jgi:hypothetical protein